ncbi:MAG: hypothetical protein VR67_13830 [Peptococcaceae bacterium BRH_c8a]|nr:MAG: hypothetical protein VR67_13830 [Peptococcaceae bacterium BRH_c8a]
MGINGRKDNMDYLSIDLASLLAALKRHYLKIILVTLMTVAASGLVSFYYLLPVYEARVMIMVNQAPGDIENATATINTYVGQVKSDVLMQRVINKLNLKRQDIAVTQPFSYDVRSEQTVTPRSLSKQVNAGAVKDSNLIEITVKNNNARMAALITNTLSQEFMLLMMENNRQMVEQTIQSLRNHILSVQQQMTSATDPAEKQLYVDTLALLNDRIKIANSIDMGNIGMVITSPAMDPITPISPNKILNMILALMLGLMVSVIYVFIKESLNNTFKTPEDVAEHLNLPVLGSILHAGRHGQ